MQDSWKAFLEALWSSRSVPPHPMWRRKALLHVAIAMAIALAAGPEIVAAMEMTALLELLGASLFLTAFRAGAVLALLRLWEVFCRVVLPAPQLVILRSDARVPAKAMALTYVSAHAAWCLAFAFIVVEWWNHVLQVAI
jgi:hypothetical protein